MHLTQHGIYSGSIIALSMICFYHPAYSQANKQQDGKVSDSAVLKNTLSEVVVSAFEQNKKLSDQPAPLAYISSTAFSRYQKTNILSAVNAIPGVRIEQRSPMSFRLDIRGSSIRAPFGVRNVKIYYNGMPLTQPGGNTYLNQLSFDDIASLEIIKGPSGSLYGAGTGGVVLIHSSLFADTVKKQNEIQLNLGGGSYGLQKISASLRWGKNENGNELRYSDMKSNGYRNHTSTHNRIASFETRLIENDSRELDVFFHYTDLFYETPGALTKKQFDQNPKAARPASGIYPSAEENKAAVYQKAFFMGLKHTYRFSSHFQNSTVLYGAYTDFTNPTIRNYEFRKEPHFGGRTVFQYHFHGQKVHSKFWLGAEMQQGYFSQKDLQNKHGNPDTLMTDDRINDFTALLFAQAEFSFSHGWDITAGISLDHEHLKFTRLYPSPVRIFNKRYSLILSPRMALSKKLNAGILLYADISKGFSPPSVAEILPSTTVLNTKLQAEEGINYEIGSKGHLLHQKFYYDVSAFIFHLTQSISLRRDSSGADYFENAGGALQKGLETSFTYNIYENKHAFITNMDAWLSQTLFDFRYKNYRSADKDYSDNHIPGTAPYTTAAGLDINTRVRLQAHITWQRTSKIPLNDGNNEYSAPYNLLGCRISYKKVLSKKISFILSGGGNNLLNETYSLGNDINAIGGRYYNVAPGINFYGNINFKFKF